MVTFILLIFSDELCFLLSARLSGIQQLFKLLEQNDLVFSHCHSPCHCLKLTWLMCVVKLVEMASIAPFSRFSWRHRSSHWSWLDLLLWWYGCHLRTQEMAISRPRTPSPPVLRRHQPGVWPIHSIKFNILLWSLNLWTKLPYLASWYCHVYDLIIGWFWLAPFKSLRALH